ncbi:MAG: urate hydroxylase PuuD [Alphaproteobacteria bacterium]
MQGITDSLSRTVLVGLALTVLILVASPFTEGGGPGWGVSGGEMLTSLFRWAHVLSGVMWIGLLWYFNFVQIPVMPSIPDEMKPAVGKHIAPEALFWFRWGAMATLITGLVLAMFNYYLLDALMLKNLLGYGMWFGIIMWFNVWFIIWPNQKIALGIIDAPAEAKPAAAAKAKMFSRINTLLSIPMLYAMVSMQAGFRIPLG